MRLSFVSRPMAVEEYRDMSATFGSDDEKAPYHQFGTRFMPQRQILNVEEGGDLADDVNSVLARYIFEERL
jgi:phage gpG-like protein